MGLDLSHCDAHWSYSRFHEFRSRLAEAIGIQLDDMAGFGGNQSWKSVVDDIVPLLNHSDCDGELSVEDCLRMAPRLRELIADWPDDSDKRRAILLAEGMEVAAGENQPLRFQ